MSMFIYGLAIIGATMVLLTVAVLVILCIQQIKEYFGEREWDRNKDWFRTYIYNVKTWCGYDFPEMDELCDIFLEGIDTGKWQDISAWRDKMRTKFKLKEPK